MNKLLKPTFVMSFVLVLTGLIPQVPFYMPIMGLVSMLAAGAMGVELLGSEDKNYESQLELVRLEHLKAHDLLDLHRKKYEDLLNQVSKGVSDLRSEAGRLR